MPEDLGLKDLGLMGFEVKNPEYRKFVGQILKAQPFMMALGVALTRIDPGEVELSLPVRADHLQHGGFVHGGVIVALADNAGGVTAATLLPQGQAVVTAEYRISFLAPAAGQKLIARGTVLRPGRSLIHTRSDVFAVADERETLVATGLGSMVPYPMTRA
jgi:uncharacterized protein (TIGR00369 family)